MGDGSAPGRPDGRAVRLAIASGKGGTGKTTLALNLALAIDQPVQLLDCDVEEPNCQLFLHADLDERDPVTVSVPRIDLGACTACGECGRVCQFHAIVSLKTTPLVFPDLCHGCGACVRICPEHAISEVARDIGILEIGGFESVRFIQGTLNVGHPMPVPVIRAVTRAASDALPAIIDCPPGTSCPMVAAVRESDAVILVTEPTPFGLHDLTLAVATIRQLGLPMGVVINRSGIGDDRVRDYCRAESIPLLLEIPDDRRVAEGYARGMLALDIVTGLGDQLRQLWRDATRLAAPAVVSSPAWNAVEA